MESTLIFNDKVIFLSDISYIERKTTKHKKKSKDSADVAFPEITYDIVIYLKSAGRTITTWYPNQSRRDEDYKTLMNLFKENKVENLFSSLFKKDEEKDN